MVRRSLTFHWRLRIVGVLTLRFEDLYKFQECNGIISFHVISNNFDADQNRQKLTWLLQLQCLFSTQLPRMPKEYITRLVFDNRHKNLVIVKKGCLS